MDDIIPEFFLFLGCVSSSTTNVESRKLSNMSSSVGFNNTGLIKGMASGESSYQYFLLSRSSWKTLVLAQKQGISDAKS